MPHDCEPSAWQLTNGPALFHWVWLGFPCSTCSPNRHYAVCCTLFRYPSQAVLPCLTVRISTEEGEVTRGLHWDADSEIPLAASPLMANWHQCEEPEQMGGLSLCAGFNNLLVQTHTRSWGVLMHHCCGVTCAAYCVWSGSNGCIRARRFNIIVNTIERKSAWVSNFSLSWGGVSLWVTCTSKTVEKEEKGNASSNVATNLGWFLVRGSSRSGCPN